MVVEKFNYTGRATIDKEDTIIKIVYDSKGSISFEAEPLLKKYAEAENWGNDAEIFIEAQRQMQYLRFPFGTIGSPQTPKNTCLDEFSTPDGIQFRLKVRSPKDGKILGSVDGIKSEQDKKQKSLSLLSCRLDGLGPIPWKIDFSSTGVSLLINDQIPNLKIEFTSPYLNALIQPAILREILTYILPKAEPYDSSDSNNWMAEWLNFVKINLGVELPDSNNGNLDDQIENCIDTSISAFSRKHGFIKILKGKLEQ